MGTQYGELKFVEANEQFVRSLLGIWNARMNGMKVID